MNRYTNARLKAYPAKTVMQVATRDIFPVSSDARANRPYGVSPPGKAKIQNGPWRKASDGQSPMPGILLYVIISNL